MSVIGRKKRLLKKVDAKTIWGVKVAAVAVILVSISLVALDTVMPWLLSTSETTADHTFWYFAGYAIGMTLYALQRYARKYSNRAMTWLSGILHGLVALGIMALYHEANVFAARATASAPIDHVYWIATTFTVGAVVGYILGIFALQTRG